MNKKVLVFALIAVTVVLGGIFVLNSSDKKEETFKISSTPFPSAQITEQAATDSKASFTIFTHGTLRIFIDAKYHNQSEDVFIQFDNPNIIHVKKQGTTWDDFFKTLPLKLDKDCLTTGTGQIFCTGSSGKLRFYINGVEAPSVLEKQINDGDKLLVTYGNDSEQQIQKQLQKIPSSR